MHGMTNAHNTAKKRTIKILMETRDWLLYYFDLNDGGSVWKLIIGFFENVSLSTKRKHLDCLHYLLWILNWYYWLYVYI